MSRRTSKALETVLPLVSRPNQQDKKNKIYQKVYDAWKKKDLQAFVANLDPAVFDYSYPQDKNLRILDLIVSETHCNLDFLEAILRLNPNVNAFNPKIRYVALHLATSSGNFAAFWRLIEEGADPNIQDRDGDTILNYIVDKFENDPEGNLKFLTQVLKLETIAVNVPNLKGVTPIAFAAEKGYEEIVKEFLNLGGCIDLDTFQDSSNKTAREIISTNFPHLVQELPGPWQPNPKRGIDYKYHIFYFLHQKQEKMIQEILEQALEATNKHELFESVDARGLTFLQNAVQLPTVKTMRILIKSGANVNYALPGTGRPIFEAAYKSLPCFSELLSNKDVQIEPNAKGETLLHVLCKSRDSSFLHGDALRRVLNLKSLDINAKDNTGQTALHLAVTHAHEKTIFKLLDKGARLDIQNNLGEIPFSHLNPNTHCNYLNTKITVNEEFSAQDPNYTIFFDYKFISSDSGTEHVHDISIKPLCTILNSKAHRKLLAHPVIAAILYFKWKKIRWLFYLYLFLSILFCAFLTTFIYLEEPSISCHSKNLNKTFIITVQWFLWIYLISRAIWEIIDLFYDHLQYLKSIENYLQIAMISCAVIWISYGCPGNLEKLQLCRSFSSFAVLFAWIELFFITGKHPKTNAFIGMFRKATWFLIQFLAVHTTLILAFVFSFYFMFRNEKGEFESLPKALFKVLVMISGEYQIGDLPLDSSPIMSHILFVLFLFLVIIVLFNLLIGLAVSATRPIEEDSFLYGCIAQVPIVSLIEKTFLNLNIKFFKNKFCKKNPQSNTYPVLAIRPNKSKEQMKIILREKSCEKNGIYELLKAKNSEFTIEHILSRRIVEDAQKIITKAQTDPQCEKSTI